MIGNIEIMLFVIETDKIEFSINTPVAPHKSVKFV